MERLKVPTTASQDLVRAAFVLSRTGVTSRVVSGGAYTLIGVFSRTLITVCSVAILARLLTPADFGYVAMATVVAELAALFTNFGFSQVLVQRPRISRLQLDTVFWSSLALGIAVAAGVFFLSYPAAALYGEETTGALLRFMSLSFVIASLTVVPEAILTRLMLYRKLLFLQIAYLSIRAIAAIALAIIGFGVWSLIIGAIIATFSQLILTARAVGYLPRVRFSLAYVLAIARTSASYFGGGILYYINTNLDLFLIGRQLGPTATGYYQISRSLTDEVRTRIAIPLQRVLFPAYSAIQDDSARLHHAVIRSSRLLAIVVFPVGAGIFATADELTLLLYGPQWLAMIPVLKLLGLSAIPKASGAVAAPIFNATNRVATALRYNTVGTALMAAGVIATVNFGIVAVASAVLVTSLYTLFMLHVAFRVIGLGTGAIRTVLVPPAVASALMAASVFMVKHLEIANDLSAPVLLLLCMITGAITYTISIAILSPALRSDVIDTLSHLRSHFAPRKQSVV
jgi:O-antigen/teichoic acid export membrane protein